MLIIPSLEKTASTVNKLKDGSDEFPEHFLRNHFSNIFVEGHQLPEVFALIGGGRDRGISCAGLATLCPVRLPHMWLFFLPLVLEKPH
jgi:hypothetical protein